MDISRPGIFLIYLSLFPIAYYYKYQQDNNKIGGKIAYSKSLWLMYCIFTWFILPLYFFIYKNQSPFWIVYAIFGLNFWIRGLIEMLLLFKTKNWKPLYGISHNIFSFLLLAGLLIYFREGMIFFEIQHFIAILISLCLETYFAFFFQKYIGEKTQGDNAVWFANAEDPLFAKNLQVTKVAVIILYIELVFALYFI